MLVEKLLQYIILQKKNNNNIKKIFWSRKIINFPKNSSMNLNKLNEIISKKIR